MASRTLVVVIDDDLSVRESLPDLLGSLGFAVKTYASAEEFLASGGIATAQCLLLDIGLPGMSGPELHRKLVSEGYEIPSIFITARSEQSIPPGLIKAQRGVAACLFKPFDEEELREALETAVGPGSSYHG